MSYTLAVIDMQRQFYAATLPEVQVGVQNVVKQAIEDNAAIVFVEYGNYDFNKKKPISRNPTLLSISNIAKKYKKKTKVIKLTDGGGHELVKKIRSNKFPIKTIKFCGVNLSYCVASTVNQTSEILPHSNIEILIDATGDESDDECSNNTIHSLISRANKIFKKTKNTRIIK